MEHQINAPDHFVHEGRFQFIQTPYYTFSEQKKQTAGSRKTGFEVFILR